MNNIQINNIYLSAADIKSGKLKDVFSDHSDISREEQDSIESFLLDWFSENDFVEVRTSGSTGEPKVISMKKQTMINSASATIKYFDLKAGDKVLLPLSVNYIAGKMMMVRAIVGGLNLRIVAAKSNPLKSLNEIFKFSAMVPLQIEKIISDNKEDNFDMIEKIIIGGAPLKDSLKNTLVKSSCDFYETYGMTETASHVALDRKSVV